MSQLGDQFRRQIRYLETSSRLFDEGDIDEAMRLAVTIRVLVHDTQTSHSLLNQMGLKQTIRFLDTAVVGGTEIFLGAVVMQIEYSAGGVTGLHAPSGQDGLVEIVPRPDGTPLIVAPRRRRGHESSIGFDTWWTTNVIDTAHGPKTFSRRRAVLVMANKDGGAHVDPDGPDVDYMAFSSLGHGSTFTTEGIDPFAPNAPGYQPFGGNAAAETVRQIAWELTETFREDPIVTAWLADN
ncbi:hypothetical protein ACHMZP_21730 [Rhodococcus baikonurensis]|uniref:hypothetical protein n=1 Tax=Rhodococcus baikonurensis TaxID=172041 RepID=UPI0037BB2028